MSTGEWIVLTAIAVAVAAALAGVVHLHLRGLGEPPSGRAEGESLSPPDTRAGWRRDRSTPVLLVLALVSLVATAAVLLEYPGLDIWAFVIFTGLVLFWWLVGLLSVGHRGGADGAETATRSSEV